MSESAINSAHATNLIKVTLKNLGWEVIQHSLLSEPGFHRFPRFPFSSKWFKWSFILLRCGIAKIVRWLVYIKTHRVCQVIQKPSNQWEEVVKWRRTRYKLICNKYLKKQLKCFIFDKTARTYEPTQYAMCIFSLKENIW